jgi:hypothetical protein
MALSLMRQYVVLKYQYLTRFRMVSGCRAPAASCRSPAMNWWGKSADIRQEKAIKWIRDIKNIYK